MRVALLAGDALLVTWSWTVRACDSGCTEQKSGRDDDRSYCFLHHDLAIARRLSPTAP
jgi:hypothetical protein